MDSIFTFHYKDKKFDINKSDIVFKDLLALICLPIDDGFIKGVVDRNYKIVIPFSKDYSFLELFADNNVVFSRSIGIFSENEDAFHLKIDLVSISLISSFKETDFEKIDDETLKTGYKVGSRRFEKIYNITSGKYVSLVFNSISEFSKLSECSDELFALARREYDLREESYYLMCYIDLLGRIRTSVFSSQIGTLIKVDEKFILNKLIDALKSQPICEPLNEDNYVKILGSYIPPLKS